MMLLGRVFKESGRWWGAEVPMIDVFTQGKSRKDAAAMLADAFASLIGRPGLEISIMDYGDAAGTVAIESNEPAVFAAFVLQRLRERSGLSLADVARGMGKASRNAYARYEQGEAVPTIEKFDQLLRAVSADTTLIIGSRQGPVAVPARSRVSARRLARGPSAATRYAGGRCPRSG